MKQMVMRAPITRVDVPRRLVYAVATSEAVDSFGTRFSYAASVAAFKAAFGNVREMHSLIAVGRLVKWVGDPIKRTIAVTIYISEGAESTWQKVLDGTLRGVSIGADPKAWETAADNVRTCTAYDLVELSLVDEPSNADALITSYRAWRANGMADGEELTGGELDAKPESKMAGDPKKHAMRDTALECARAAADDCGCDECGDVSDMLARRPKATRGGRAGVSQAALIAQLQRVMNQQSAALLRALGGRFDDLESRLTIIEAQPAPGGPQLMDRAVQRALNGTVYGADTGRYRTAQATRGAQIDALIAAAQATTDQHAQIALSAEIGRLEEEERASGMSRR